MAESTKISWCDSTANFWTGCTKISPACYNCYAETLVINRLGGTWGPHGTRTWVKAGPQVLLKFHRAALRNGGVDPKLVRRRRVFINSLSDIFDNHKSIERDKRDGVFELLELCHTLDIILVTKRLQNLEKIAPTMWTVGRRWPSHIWLVTTIENRDEQIRRAPLLKALKSLHHIPVVGVSAEPLLEPLDWWSLMGDGEIDWLIVGGEKAAKAKVRPMNDDWARDAMLVAGRTNTAFHFKQTTNAGPIPDDLQVREYPR